MSRVEFAVRVDAELTTGHSFQDPTRPAFISDAVVVIGRKSQIACHVTVQCTRT